MLANTPITTNICTTDIQRAVAFYRDTLGLEQKADYGSAAFFHAGGAPLFIYQREGAPKADHTVANWDVDDIEATVDWLVGQGVKMERFDGFDQDARGISQYQEGGPKAAWFKDPDGNILGVVQPPS
ncbi:MAG: VOC family protein [Thermoplasmatota archaeon]